MTDRESHPAPSAADASGTAASTTPTLVTGAAGFIGFHTAAKLLRRGTPVIGIDSFNAYYDPALKEGRLKALEAVAADTGTALNFIRGDLADNSICTRLFDEHKPARVIHLAAQAGVRHSLEAPRDYIDANIVGFMNILEGCRAHRAQHLTYASTSSVYGANTKLPFKETDRADHPLQLYAATKRSNELMAHAYSHLFNLPTTGLRFFTVYGPWGRPDMALFLFTKAILAGEPIKLFNGGNHRRDFTYIDDIVEGVIRASDDVAAPNANWNSDTPEPSSSAAPYRIFNIGNNEPVNLLDYVEALEDALGRKAERELLPLQPGDVPDSHADAHALAEAVGYRPQTEVKIGVQKFVDWYKDYYGVS